MVQRPGRESFSDLFSKERYAVSTRPRSDWCQPNRQQPKSMVYDGEIADMTGGETSSPDSFDTWSAPTADRLFETRAGC
jgi:hypothetical protein